VGLRLIWHYHDRLSGSIVAVWIFGHGRVADLTASFQIPLPFFFAVVVQKVKTDDKTTSANYAANNDTDLFTTAARWDAWTASPTHTTYHGSTTKTDTTWPASTRWPATTTTLKISQFVDQPIVVIVAWGVLVGPLGM
jgi:hypothetical protein